MLYKLVIAFSVFLLLGNNILAQEVLDIDTKHSCIYHGNVIDEDLYTFAPTSKEMESRVKRILKLGGDLRINFYIVQTNVQNVSAVIDGDKRFLLWSQDFFLNASDIEKVGMTAHEMAHHLNKHSLTVAHHEKEEAEADFFMGYVFAKTKFTKADIKSFVTNTPRSGDHGFNAKRYQNILNGFEKGQAFLTAENGGWDGANATIQNFLTAQFPFPPPQCHTAYEIPSNYFRDARSLGRVSKKITNALDEKQYPYRFMSVPNGFAIVTQMEQYYKDGNIMNGSSHRWVDYPPQESFAFSWDYIKSLIYPKRGYLRLFVFIVSSQNYASGKKRVTKDEASAWLSQGVNRLPKSVSSKNFNEDYSVSFLTYEFEVPESNHQVRQSCPCNLPAAEHFTKTALRQIIGDFP